MQWCGVIAVVYLLGAQAAAAASTDDADVQHWINTHAQRSQSAELLSARSGVVGDLDGDARDDLAVLYTLRPDGIHGQRSERRYLAVFKRRGGTRNAPHYNRLYYHAHVLVGGAGVAEANRATILNKTVVVELLTPRAGDAACCPTRPATRRYRLAPRGLTLVKAAAKAGVGMK